MERIENGSLAVVRHVCHTLGEDDGAGSDDEGHDGGGEPSQVLHLGGASQPQPEQGPGQAVEADVEDEPEVRSLGQRGLGVVDSHGLREGSFTENIIIYTILRQEG